MPSRSKRSVAADDLYRIERISDVRLAPNGRQVIFVQQRIDRQSEKKTSNLWLAPVRGGSPQQFTYGDQSDYSPRWSPDGDTIAFMSNRGDEKQAQIYLIPLAGGEARPLTTLKGNIGEFCWSPDGKTIALTLIQPDKDALEREADEQKKKLGVVARQITTTSYKHDGYGYLPEEKGHIWLVDAANGKARQLTPAGTLHGEDAPAWSPDGQTLAFVSNRSPQPDLAPDRDDLYLISAAGGEMTRLEMPIGPKMMPSFSPDGSLLAYYGLEGEGNWARNITLWVAPADGSGPARSLTAALDWNLGGDGLSDVGGGGTPAPIWSREGDALYLTIEREGDHAFYRVPLDGSGPTRVVDEPGVVGSPGFDREQTRLAYIFAAMDALPQVYVQEIPSGRRRQVTRVNSRWFNRLALGAVEEVRIAAPDGYPIHGWIMFPPGFDPAQTYPSILEIHGGPMSMYDRGFMHEFRVLSAAGYVVYFCNPRGSQGYGEAHCTAINNQWGTIDYDDVVAWSDYVAAQPYIDTARMGVTGGSYGGYMTNMLVGRSRRFAAAVTQRSVSNLISMWGSSDGNWNFQSILADGQMPFEALAQYWDHSPMKYIGGAQTPTLVIHSEQDLRCNLEQAEQVFVALKKLGVDAEMVLFPDSSHGLSRGGRTDRRIARLNHMLRWFDHLPESGLAAGAQTTKKRRPVWPPLCLSGSAAPSCGPPGSALRAHRRAGRQSPVPAGCAPRPTRRRQ